MKQSDIITIGLTMVIGVVMAIFASNALLGDPDQETVSFQVVEAIDSGLAQPDGEVFNSAAANPTVEVYVGACEDVDQNGVIDSAERLACGTEGAGLEDEDEYEDEDEDETVEIVEDDEYVEDEE